MGRWYNRSMKRIKILSLILLIISLACIVGGNLPARSETEKIDVEFQNGDKASIMVTLPKEAWVGEKTKGSVDFTLLTSRKIDSARMVVKMEIEGVTIEPRGEIQLVFDPSQTAEVQLDITPLQKGMLRGSLWVYAGEGGTLLETLLARSVQIEGRTILGITPVWWQRGGYFLLLLSIFLFFAVPGYKRHLNKEQSKHEEKMRRQSR